MKMPCGKFSSSLTGEERDAHPQGVKIGDKHGRMARGAHGLAKVSPGPSMPYLSMPCEWATPEMALQLFQGWPGRSS
jgi:hypothetical protein